MGMLYDLQRWVGTATPVLQYKHIDIQDWSGTWLGTLAGALQQTPLTTQGFPGLPMLRVADAAIVDLVQPSQRSEVAEGCRHLKLWRLSEVVHYDPADSESPYHPNIIVFL